MKPYADHTPGTSSHPSVPDLSFDTDTSMRSHEMTSLLVEQCRRARKQKQLSQRDLNRLSGVTLSSLKRFEQTGEISLTSLVRLLVALGLGLDLDSREEKKKRGRPDKL